MAYTVTKLINNAYYSSGIVSRKYQKPTTEQLNDGLDLLNDLFAIKTADNSLVPYYSSYTFNTVPTTETYFIPNIIYPETVTYNYQTVVRFATYKQTRKVYQGSARVNGITSLPFNVYFERALGGGNLSMYFLPNAIYPFTVWGKFSMASVTLNQNLELTLDRFYLVYLRYALGRAICDFFHMPFLFNDQLEDYEEQITSISPADLSMDKLSTLQGRTGMNWAYVNFPSPYVVPT